ACSLICYCLGITHVDPLRYDLYFERFLNPERHDPPDIDLDLSWKERDQIREWIIQRHGADRVAMISVTNRYGLRSARREAARAFGLPDQPLAPEIARSLHSAAQKLEGLPHHLGVHCAGLVISPRPLWNDLALQRSGRGLIVTQPDMHPVEALGLVKVDLLGNRSLAVLDDTTRIVTHQNGTPPDLSDHERLAQDPKTHAMLRNGHTIGCFYIESPAMRSLLRKLQIRNYLDVVAASSVIRPGVAKSGMLQTYIERTRDPAKTVFLHPKMASLLAETHGVMIYQEDVLKVAHEVGGMSLSQADTLRRAMSGKGRDRKRLASMGDFFLRACNRNHIASSIGQEIWRQIESFAGYAFCKAHSASFARLSLQVAYLKSHYPAEFMAAVLANGGGFYERSTYISECRRLGLALRGPDVNQSEVLDTGSGGNIRLGLGAIRELNESIAHSIVTARRERPFDSIADCLTRTSLGEESAKNLARVGGFSSLDPRESACLLEIQRLFRDSTLASRIHEPRQHNLFLPLAPKLPTSPSLPPCHSPEVEPFPPRVRALFEMEILGFPLASHPLDLLREHLQKDLIEATAMSRYRSRPVRMLGWIIASKSVPVRPNNHLMKFISCEDRSGTFEVILFPDVCKRFSRTLQSRALLIEGQVEEENGSPSLIANRLISLPTDSLLPTTTFPCPP
ncbi:MAG: hypothetical protein QF752_01655, partial [Planctomycetota bacterium]|nr:hypothetical protein [Planctomycetota bacterium]